MQSTSQITSNKSVESPSMLSEAELPATFAQYKSMVSEQLQKRYQALIKTYQAMTQEPEFVTLLNTAPSSADKTKRFDTTYEKAGTLLESFASAVELLGSALLPEASLKMQYRSMVAHKANKGLRDKLEHDEAKIQVNVQILYNQAKEIADRYNIPLEIIDSYLANEDYVALDKLIMKDKKCKHGLRYSSTGEIKCIRKREVMRAERAERAEPPQPKQSCFQRRKAECINTDYCAWEVGKRCKSKAKIQKQNQGAVFKTYQNPAYNKSLSTASPANFAVMKNPLYRRVGSISS